MRSLLGGVSRQPIEAILARTVSGPECWDAAQLLRSVRGSDRRADREATLRSSRADGNMPAVVAWVTVDAREDFTGTGHQLNRKSEV